MTRGDDLCPTHNGYSTITDYRCPDEIMIMASQSSQTGETGPIVLKLFETKVKILKSSSSSFKISRSINFEVSSSPFKMLVRNLIFKTSSFVISHLYKTLFRHLLIRLFNHSYSLIQTLQIPTLDSDLMCLSSEIERLFLTSSHYELGSYVLSLQNFVII